MYFDRLQSPFRSFRRPVLPAYTQALPGGVLAQRCIGDASSSIRLLSTHKTILRGNQLSYPHCLPTDSSAQYSYMLCNFDNFRRSFGLVEQHWSFVLHPLMQGYIEDKKPNTCNITLKRSVFFN